MFRPANAAGAGDTRWQAGFDLPNGTDGNVNAVARVGNDVYIGGSFTVAGTGAANHVARWNGTAWSSLGTGAANGTNEAVRALAVAANGLVYAGGTFDQAGGVPAGHVAQWNGAAWASLGTGTGVAPGTASFVLALAAAPNGDVYVGGSFALAGGVAANNVAKWNGTAWASLGTGAANGVDKDVDALAVAPNGDVYAGGTFSQIGGIAANGLAKWNGTAWGFLNPNGPDLNGNVSALTVTPSGDVYVGGGFTQAGGAAANGLAKWNGTTWAALGTGVSQPAAVVVAPNGDVYVGGDFAQAGGVAASRVARWDGTAWSPLGTGTNGYVAALANAPGGKLYVGGYFTTLGDGSRVMARFGTYDPSLALATAAPAGAAPLALFPNPAHGTATLRLPAAAPRLPLADLQSRLVRQYPAPASDEATLDLHGLPAGLYLLRCGQLRGHLTVN